MGERRTGQGPPRPQAQMPLTFAHQQELAAHVAMVYGPTLFNLGLGYNGVAEYRRPRPSPQGAPAGSLVTLRGSKFRVFMAKESGNAILQFVSTRHGETHLRLDRVARLRVSGYDFSAEWKATLDAASADPSAEDFLCFCVEQLTQLESAQGEVPLPPDAPPPIQHVPLWPLPPDARGPPRRCRGRAGMAVAPAAPLFHARAMGPPEVDQVSLANTFGALNLEGDDDEDDESGSEAAEDAAVDLEGDSESDEEIVFGQPLPLIVPGAWQTRYLRVRAQCGRADQLAVPISRAEQQGQWLACSGHLDVVYATLRSVQTEVSLWYAETLAAEPGGEAVPEDSLHDAESFGELRSSYLLVRDHTEQRRVDVQSKAQRRQSFLEQTLQPQWADRDEAKQRMGEERWNSNPSARHDFARQRRHLEIEYRALKTLLEKMEGYILE